MSRYARPQPPSSPDWSCLSPSSVLQAPSGWSALYCGEPAIIVPLCHYPATLVLGNPSSKPAFPKPAQKTRAEGLPCLVIGLTRPPAAEVFESLKKVRTPPSNTVQEALQCFFLRTEGSGGGQGLDLRLFWRTHPHPTPHRTYSFKNTAWGTGPTELDSHHVITGRQGTLGASVSSQDFA